MSQWLIVTGCGNRLLARCKNDKSFKAKSLAPGVNIKALTGENMSMVVFYIAPGADVPEHSHPHEQMGTVLIGSLELIIKDEKKSGQAGRCLVCTPQCGPQGPLP